MSVEVIYRCNGCDAEASVTGLHKTWTVIRSGRTWDLCQVATPTIESAAPEGWKAFDPYTGMTYCPTCWAEIEAPHSEKVVLLVDGPEGLVPE